MLEPGAVAPDLHHTDLHRLLARTGRAVARSQRPTAMGVLAVVARLGPTAHRELAAATGVAPATLTAAVDALEQRGEVVRVRDELDRRVVRVALTPAGRARLASCDDPTGNLPLPSPPEVEVVRRYLESVLAALGE